jgi:hypothetical protein
LSTYGERDGRNIPHLLRFLQLFPIRAIADRRQTRNNPVIKVTVSACAMSSRACRHMAAGHRVCFCCTVLPTMLRRHARPRLLLLLLSLCWCRLWLCSGLRGCVAAWTLLLLLGRRCAIRHMPVRPLRRVYWQCRPCRQQQPRVRVHQHQSEWEAPQIAGHCRVRVVMNTVPRDRKDSSCKGRVRADP